MSEERSKYQYAVEVLKLAIDNEADKQDHFNRLGPDTYKDHIAQSEVRAAECSGAITLLEGQQ
jgi:hypothetical protein